MDPHSRINKPILDPISASDKIKLATLSFEFHLRAVEIKWHLLVSICSILGKSYKERAVFFFFFCWDKRLTLGWQCLETELLELLTIKQTANGSWKPGSVCSQYFRSPPKVVLYRDLIAFWHMARVEMENAQICCCCSNCTWIFESDIESDTAFSWCFYPHFSCMH